MNTIYIVAACALLAQIDSSDETKIDASVDLLRAAAKYSLETLKLRCEENLSSSVTVANSVKLLSIANELNAETLKKFTKDVIRDNWEEINPYVFTFVCVRAWESRLCVAVYVCTPDLTRCCADVLCSVRRCPTRTLRTALV